QQGIPEFKWSDNALKVRQYLYESWCDKGWGPSLRNVHEDLGLSREEIIAAYKELELGKMIVVDQHSQNFNMLKMLPFNSFPSQMYMCDSMNYVIDAKHAERYERKVARRGVLFTIEQAQPFVKPVADARMWDYHWPNAPLTPGPILDGMRALGIDVSNWDPST